VSWEEFVKSEEVEKFMLNELDQVWKSNQLKSIERISAVKLFPEEWTAENGWLYVVVLCIHFNDTLSSEQQQ
jgi:long-subunit acyl-CoA synthetase (AMP-forming)